MLIMSSIGILDHVIILPLILQTASRDAWVSVLLAGGLLLCWIPILYLVMKRTRQRHPMDWIAQRTHPYVAVFLVCLVALELLAIGTMTLMDVTRWAKVSYLTETPYFMIVLLFACSAFYMSVSGIHTIAIVNGILLPFVILLGLFVMASNIPHKDYSLLLPVFEFGWEPVLKGMLYAGSGFAGMTLVLFMQHHAKPFRLGSLLLVGILLINLTISPLTAAIAEFGPYLAADLRFPAFEEWRLVNFSHFLEHVDFLSIYQWLVGSFVRISLALFMIPDLLQVRDKKKRVRLLLALFILMVGISQIPISDMTFMRMIGSIYLPWSFVFLFAISFVLLGLSLKTPKGEMSE